MDETSDSRAVVGEADVTEADLAHAQARLARSKRFPWLTPLLLLLAGLSYWALSPSESGSQVLLSIVLPMAVVVALTLYLQSRGRRAWVKQAFANIGGQTTFRFDDFGFSSASKLREHRLAWAALTRSLETPEVFLVYTSPATLLVVPKRAFTVQGVATLGRWLPERITQPLPQRAGLFGGAFASRPLVLWLVLIVAFLAIWQFLGVPLPPQRPAAADDPMVSGSGGGEASDVDSSP